MARLKTQCDMLNKEVGGMEKRESDLTTSHVSDDDEELTTTRKAMCTGSGRAPRQSILKCKSTVSKLM